MIAAPPRAIVAAGQQLVAQSEFVDRAPP